MDRAYVLFIHILDPIKRWTMPFQHPTTEILLATALSFSILLILFVMVGAAVKSILSEDRAEIEPPQEIQPKDRNEL